MERQAGPAGTSRSPALRLVAGPAPDAAVAPAPGPDTDGGVPATIPAYAAHARNARVAAIASAQRHTVGDTRALRAARSTGAPAEARLELPAGAAARTVDADGRLKLNGTVPVSELLGWEPGALAVAFDGDWAVLTQRAGMAGAARQRHSTLAHLVRLASGIERICLAPAHLARLGLGEDRVLLTAPFPATGGLLLVTPAVALAGAPAHLVAPADDG